MQNGDEASPSIILAGRAPLVKMLITLEPHGIFSSNFACLYISSSPEPKAQGELIVYQSNRRLSVCLSVCLAVCQHFPTRISPQPVGQS